MADEGDKWADENKENEQIDNTPEDIDMAEGNIDDGGNDQNEAKARKRGRPRKKTDNAIEELLAKDEIIRTLEDEIKRCLEEKKLLASSRDRDIAVLRQAVADKSDELDNLQAEAAKAHRKSKELINELQLSNQELLNVVSSKEDELAKLKQLLDERDNDVTELLEQVASHDTQDVSLKPEPKGLCIVDEISEVLFNGLPSGVTWSCNKCTLSNLSLAPEIFDSYDIVLLLNGTCDINEGLSGIQAYRKMTKIVDVLSGHGHLALMLLPPGSAATQISIYNMKIKQFLNSLDEEKNELIEWNTRYAARAELFSNNGKTMTPKCVDVMSSSITKHLTIPQKSAVGQKPKSNKDASTPLMNDRDPIKCLAEINKGMIGRIIGRNGRTIRRLSDDHNVKIDIGSWLIPNKEDREDVISLIRNKCETLTDAITVSGKVGDVKNVLNEIKLITDDLPEKKAKN